MANNQKREASTTDEDSTSKRQKSSDPLTETAHTQSGASQETNGEIRGTSHNKIEAQADKCVPDENATVDRKVLGEPETVLTGIEADAAEDKGCRHTMEDAWVVLPNGCTESHGKLRCAHFAIYDGHGGRLAAEYAQKHLHPNVVAAGLPRELVDVKAAKKAIIEGFRRTDESLLQESTKGNWQDGATAVCVWILGQTAGGSVGPNGRLQGRIEVSRALGDRQFKKFFSYVVVLSSSIVSITNEQNYKSCIEELDLAQVVGDAGVSVHEHHPVIFLILVGLIATPDVHSFELTKKDHFVILGCDGLWGVFGPSDAVEFVQKQLKETSSASVVVRRLVKEAVRERRCKDNCTAILIVFKHY
ncbi:hypothetical protein PR202_ga16170 [Eleusine coracana subsp. coracana]|uniref:protein-serine/threonine phosphatase n=1 Tax=Eleusine coracana subsp. coracana TaxID=191504 RepID=A0AAV5CLX9_ELECO|nr:hypothetical protein PR202_ga16170 [Eleusine coracana subsp. coracana]